MIMYVLVIVIAILGACKSSSPTPDPPKSVLATFAWQPGKCQDNYIIYEDSGGVLKYIDETTATKYRFELKRNEEKVMTVSGVCMSGPDQGEWKSAERVKAKW